MRDIEKTQKVEMVVLSRLQRDRTKVAAVAVLKPLIERAKTVQKLKDAALASPHLGIPADELLTLGPPSMVRGVLDKLVQAGAARINASGEYESALPLPDLSQREAATFAHKLLADWPARERDKIIAVFSEDAGDADGAGDEDDDGDEDE